MTSRYRWFVAAALPAVVLDQASKAWARSELAEGVSQPFLGGFWSWRLHFNTGVAFSLGDAAGSFGRVLFVLLALAACVATFVLLRRQPGDRGVGWFAAGLGLIAGGALGNAIDRALVGRVTDFVSWRAAGRSWPIFNVADAALLIGVVLIVLTEATRRAPAPA